MAARYWRVVLLVFLPFAAAYYLSYLFRTINALISDRLVHDFGLDASHLGLITSVHFLAFAAVQLPLGIALDRYGPQRVQCLLLPIAAIGAALFAAAGQFEVLVIGRALIGFGVAGVLIAGLKALALCFPKDRLPLANGCFIMLGTLGAVTATSPAELLLSWISWRGLFEVLAVATFAVGAIILAVVPDLDRGAAPGSPSAIRLNAIYRDPRFWRLAPLSTMCISTAWALQGLWAAPWLAEVEGLARGDIVNHLFVMAMALSLGALLLGVIADRLRKRSIQPETVLACAALLFVIAEFALVSGLRLPSYAPWAVIAGMGAATVLSYSIMSQHFPKEMAGQANAALNIFHIGGAFVLQQAIGSIIDLWSDHGGHYPPIAYKVAFGITIALQLIALLWFVRAAPKISAAKATLGPARQPATTLIK
jgi:MFS family permease